MGLPIQAGAARTVTDRSRFGKTRWSVVVAAGRSACAESAEALSTLCGIYWYPVYSYARRRGYGADESADLTQGFFARLIERKMVRGADPKLGKFRSYLLGAFKHYLSHEWARAQAVKRGGGRRAVPFDPEAAEQRYGLEPVHEMTPERLYERQWAMHVLELALEDLARRCAVEGKARQFEVLKPFLAGGHSAAYREAGATLGLGEGAARVAVHRLRQRYRHLLREHIRQTVDTAEQVDEEIQHLFSAVGA